MTTSLRTGDSFVIPTHGRAEASEESPFVVDLIPFMLKYYQ